MDYAGRKVSMIESFDYMMRLHNYDENEEYLQQARDVLQYILQKKLFNLQLQWRAGLIVIDEVQNSFDFYFWEKHIEYCPFIPPITRNELEIMKKYLQNNYFKSLHEGEYWQFYLALMERDEDGMYQNIPEWYDFYDAMFGTGQLMILPNTRGQKEDYYIEIAQEANRKEYEENYKNNPVQPFLRSIYMWYKDLDEFVAHCEKDPYFKRLFQLWQNDMHPEYNDNEYVDEFVERAIKILESADRPIILSKDEIWHQAIINSADRYVTDRILEVLDSAYEEYVTLIDLGITKRFTPDEELNEREHATFRGFTEMILKGRELCGEPRNFDIY